MKGKYAYKKKGLIASAKWVDTVGYKIHHPRASSSLKPERVLVVRLDQMGDVLQTLPAFDSLRHSFPNAKICFLTTSQGAELQSISKIADEIFVWDCGWFGNRRKPSVSFSEIISWIRSNNFDCVLELRGDIRLIAMLRLAGVKNLVGYGATGGGFLLDVEVPWNSETHAVDRNLALVEAIGGVISTRIPFINHKSSFDASKKKLAVHPDAGTSAKRWPISFFIETINYLSDIKNIEIVLIGLNKELGKAILEKTKHPVTDMTGRTSFSDLVNLLETCDGLLSNDSGPAHLMAALGRPTWVVWSGTANAAEWSPRGPEIHLFSHAVTCSPCLLSTCVVKGHPCLTEIQPMEVAGSIREHL